MAKDKIVLAYSGGLDTSVILKWLQQKYRLPVIAFVADLGQGEDLDAIAEKAKKTGAAQVVIKDLKEEFVRDYFFPALRANAAYEHYYLMGTSLARPLIAKAQMEVAHKFGARTVAHGATGKGNDQVRFELTCYAIDPGIRVIAPWREWDFQGRPDLVEYAKKHKIPVDVTPKKPYSSDPNILHISYESGILEDPWASPPEDIFRMTVSPQEAPDTPTGITVEFNSGDPVSVNGKKMKPDVLLAYLNKIAGANGIGRVDIVENRFVGMKSRGVYESPGATVLYHAHRAVESIALDREAMFLKESLMPQYARLVYFGFWFSPEREALQALVDQTQKYVSGTVRMKLYKGNCTVTGRKSPHSLYDASIGSFDIAGGYKQADADGFIKLNALRLKMQKKRR